MTESEIILGRILHLQRETEVTPEAFNVPHPAPRAVHESVMRSYGLLGLAKELLARQWPHEAILVTLALAEQIAELKQQAERKPCSA